MKKTPNKSALLSFTHGDVILKNKVARYQGFFKLDEYQVSHRLFDGSYSQVLSREVFERGDAVVLIPFDPVRQEVVLIEQFRPGAIRAGETPWMLEFIAGMFDKGESPVDVAIREAKEEANLTLDENQISPVMKYLSSPGGMSEAIYLFTATIDSTNVGGVYGLPEEGEDILVHVVKLVDALQLLEQGKIVNAATVIGLQWLALNYHQL